MKKNEYNPQKEKVKKATEQAFIPKKGWVVCPVCKTQRRFNDAFYDIDGNCVGCKQDKLIEAEINYVKATIKNLGG